MAPDWNIIISAAMLGLVIVGGYVKLRLAMAADYKDISDRLLKIETRLEMDDKSAEERRSARRREMMAIAKSVFDIEMGKGAGTNPGIQLPTDGV
jgi:hypothetical protein